VRKTIFAAVPLAVLALAAPAAAHGGRHATTYKANVVAVAAAPSDATATRHGDSAATGVRGQAKLVDGSRRDKVQLHVKGLQAGESYSWSVRSAAADGDACAGDAVDAFSYDALTARRHGHSGARTRSTSFSAEDGTSYAVVVTAADGTDVACGEFQSKADRRAAKAKRKAERRAAKRKHESSGDDQSGDDDSASGDDDSASGDEPTADDSPSGDDDPAQEDAGDDAGDDD
jgi:hypothetical protein